MTPAHPIGARTRLVGVIGHPIAHSHSPAMQNAALQALGLDWVYLAFDVAPERLGEAVRGAEALGFVGLNVTVPHKVAALELCEADALARRVGAVNTLVWDGTGDRPRGLNTDVHGFRVLLAENGFVPERKNAIVLGAGGAARAVVTALVDGGARVTVVTRGRRLGMESDPPHRGWEDLSDLLPDVDLLVDTTPRGLGAADGLVDVRRLPSSALVVDLVVWAETPLVSAARGRGLRAVTGEGMLLHQGAAALEAWTGRPAPHTVMRTALADSVARGR